jgi:hypothetical protein
MSCLSAGWRLPARYWLVISSAAVPKRGWRSEAAADGPASRHAEVI